MLVVATGNQHHHSDSTRLHARLQHPQQQRARGFARLQGFPDDEGPESMKKLASTALYEHSNQYPSLLGVPELRKAVAR
jgi:aspartate/methionine/tyrosine aminotransferase